jgi:hypothetical protein
VTPPIISRGERARLAKILQVTGMARMDHARSLPRYLWLFDVRRAEGGESRGAHMEELQKRDGRWGRHGKDEFQLVDRFFVETDGPDVEFRPRVA